MDTIKVEEIKDFDLLEKKVFELIEYARELKKENERLSGEVTSLGKEVIDFQTKNDKMLAENNKFKEQRTILGGKIETMLERIENISQSGSVH